jgi:hypothetical protein
MIARRLRGIGATAGRPLRGAKTTTGRPALQQIGHGGTAGGMVDMSARPVMSVHTITHHLDSTASQDGRRNQIPILRGCKKKSELPRIRQRPILPNESRGRRSARSRLAPLPAGRDWGTTSGGLSWRLAVSSSGRARTRTHSRFTQSHAPRAW